VVNKTPQVLQLQGEATTSTGMTFYPIGTVTISNSTFKTIANTTNQASHVQVNWINSTINGKPAR
jgi:hypothetical protein